MSNRMGIRSRWGRWIRPDKLLHPSDDLHIELWDLCVDHPGMILVLLEHFSPARKKGETKMHHEHAKGLFLVYRTLI